MKKPREQLVQQRDQDREVAVQLLATPGGEKLIRWLKLQWLKSGPGANHGEAGWSLAMHAAIEDLERLREEGTP